MLTVSLFRDARDVLPRPRQVTIAQLCDLLVPAVPKVHGELVERAQRNTRLLEAALNTVQQRKRPRPWMQGHSWYRALEQVAWVHSDQEPAVIEELVNAKAIEIHEGIQRRMKNALPCWSPEHSPRRGASTGTAAAGGAM